MKKLKEIVENLADKMGKLFCQKTFNYYYRKLYYKGCNISTLATLIVIEFQWNKQ